MEQIITAVIAGAVGLALGWLSGRFSYSNKISEFRQAWINSLRADITAYISAAEKWLQLRIQSANYVEPSAREKFLNEKFTPALIEARSILNRIQLNMNPLNNSDKLEDDALIEALANLMNERELTPDRIESKWRELSDIAVLKARKVLKREWEKTKKVIRPQWG